MQFEKVFAAVLLCGWIAAGPTLAEPWQPVTGVLEVYRMGGEIDYLIKAAVEDMPGYDRLYQDLIKADLFDVSASFVMEELKQTTELPLLI
jgi:DNA-binding Lrp family transcriptional regulator